MKYSAIDYIPKISPDNLEVLSLIYTPGVGQACLKIKENPEGSFVYTNRSNSVAVISFNYKDSLARSIFLKDALNIDAYPLEVAKKSLKLVVENISPNFCGIDLTLIADELENKKFNVKIPVLTTKNANIEEFFSPVSKNIFMFDESKLEGDFQEKALSLRELAGGVIESSLTSKEIMKPVAIVSDGSAVLGFGNIGAEAGLPVMEGKAVLFRSLGKVNAIPLCIKTQKTEEIIEIVKALENSFSGINLEDISAPRCFDVENELLEKLNIPVFHDDQHGTAIVVLAGLLNALSVVKKQIKNVKIVISGAGAAAQAVSKLIIKAGAENVIHVDKDGIVYKGREVNDKYLETLSEITNKSNLKGGLEDAMKGADVFIGLSAGGVLKPEFIKEMKRKPIVFALANPTPEIMPKEAKHAGACVIATGRSDFENQINNSLAFPGLFQGLLSNGIKKVTEKIQLECAIAIASLVKDDVLNAHNILPNALDARVVRAITGRLAKFKK